MSNSGLDIDDLLKLSALGAQEQFEEDDDDEGSLEFLGEDDGDEDSAYWGEDDDDDEYPDYALMEQDGDDESLEGLIERRRRSRGRRWKRRSYRRVAGGARRLGRVRGSRSTTLRSPTGQRMRVQFGKSYATTAEVNKLIKDTEQKFAAAMKERKTNFDRLSKQIVSASNSLEGKVGKVRKSISALEKKSQSAALLPLLMGTPKVQKITLDTDEVITGKKAYDATVEFEKPDLMLPLLLGGGLGGSSGSDNTLLLALAFSSKK